MDTNKMRDISREQFEATWADVMRGDEPPPGRKPTRSRIDPEKYAGDAAQFAWKWWQRSRAAVVVELPRITGHEYDPLADADYREGCRAAIEAQGLKVAP